MVTHLRPYQCLALYHLQRNLEAGAWRKYLDLPTGTGKSTIAAAFAARRQTQGRILAMHQRQDAPYNWPRRSARKSWRWVC